MKLNIFDGKDFGEQAKEFANEYKGQATKSAGGMPRHWEPKKDVTSCEKPRVGANNR